ncbi:MAG: PAAR domain-containing protein, partial [Azoarcus sp.]|nr:PAAR domain-containing protein [Azoarcus sp.]
MTRRNYIVLGDTTNHGGTVVSAGGQGRWDINGIPVACVDDKVTCPRCKGTHTILAGAQNPPVYCHGRIVAREGDPVSDGSVLMSVRQSLCW